MNTPEHADLNTILLRFRQLHLQSPVQTAYARQAHSVAEDGAYPDVDYVDRLPSAFPAHAHLHRLFELVRIYCDSASGQYQSGEILRKIFSGLNYWLKAKPVNRNGWWQDIGTPLLLEKILLVLHREISADQREAGSHLMRYAVRDGQFCYGHLRATGQNMIWVARIQLAVACLDGDVAHAHHAMRAIADEIRISPDEGIQPDMSFHQHGPMLYSGGYGEGFTRDGLLLAHLTLGTSFALPEEKVRLLVQYLLDGQQWMIAGKNWDFGVIGREISRRRKTAEGLALAADMAAEAVPERAANAWELAGRLRGETLATHRQPRGHRHFWRSDYTSFHGAGWRIGLKMVSTRTLGTESGNGEAEKSYHLAQGTLCLMKNGQEYEGIFPLWNWRMIPGLTCLQATGELPLIDWGQNARGTTAFVGGVSEGDTGVSAFDLDRDDLSFKKSWFFYEASVVCLGAGISSKSGLPVLTTLEQNWRNGDVIRSPHNRWLLHGSTGYSFYRGVEAHIQIETRNGAWNSINSSESQDIVSGEVFSSWIDHGTNPQDASYAYVLMPKTNASDLEKFEAPVILANTSAMQAVQYGQGLKTGLVFYRPGCITLSSELALDVQDPCILMVEKRDDSIIMTLADPSQSLDIIRINFLGAITKSVEVQLPQGLMRGSSVRQVISSR